MSQFPKMFGATRLPLQNRDRLSVNTTSTHIVVLVSGVFYSLDVLTSDGKICSEKDLAAQFEAMVNKTREETDPAAGLGIFTTGDRNDWAKIRAELEAIRKDFFSPLISFSSFQFYALL